MRPPTSVRRERPKSVSATPGALTLRQPWVWLQATASFGAKSIKPRQNLGCITAKVLVLCGASRGRTGQKHEAVL